MDVSIIVPVYNAEKYIELCLKSLINQKTRYTYEIICVNDGSSDSSKDILEKYKEDIVIINQDNAGPGIARNKGIAKSTGKYLMFADSDDYVDEYFVEKLVYNLELNDADICICDFYRVYEDKIIYVDKGKEAIYLEKNFQEPLLMEFHSVNKIFRRELFHFYPENMFFEDVVAICLSILNAKKIVKIHEALYYYRLVNESTTNTLSKKVYDLYDATLMIEDKLLESGYKDVAEFLFVNNILVDLNIKIVKAKGKKGIHELDNYLKIVNEKYPCWHKNKFLKKTRLMKRLYLFILRNRLYVIINMFYGMR